MYIVVERGFLIPSTDSVRRRHKICYDQFETSLESNNIKYMSPLMIHFKRDCQEGSHKVGRRDFQYPDKKGIRHILSKVKEFSFEI